jgi:hypothetical protein
VEREPRQIIQAGRRRVHRVERSAGRLLIAGLGFSVAYFLDAAQGRARRKQVVDVVRRLRRSAPTPDAAGADRAAADLPRIGRADLGPRSTVQRATEAIRAGARV